MLSRFIDLGVEKSKKTRQAQSTRKCQHCSGSMKGVRKDAKFCGNVCRQSDYQSRTYKPKSAKPKPHPAVADFAGRCCLNCLDALRGKQRSFCSDACRKQHQRG
jgi:hypothetical protein